MAQRHAITNSDYPARLAVLQDLYSGNLTPQKAAEALASASLINLSELDKPLTLIWVTIIVAAREEPAHQDQLVDLLSSLALLPDAQNEQNELLTIHDMRIWSDLPMLGWEFNYKWNGM